MKNTIALLCLLMGCCIAYTQDPVHWEFKSHKINNKVYEMHFVAHIDRPWHIYSTTSPDKSGMATTFSFKRNPLLQLDEPVNEKGNLITSQNDELGIVLKYFENAVDFIQVVKLRSTVKTRISGTVTYMACTETRCLPPAAATFQFTLN